MGMHFDLRHKHVLARMAPYKFYLAFENAVEDHYISPRLYEVGPTVVQLGAKMGQVCMRRGSSAPSVQALEAGVVPVYLGAVNVDEYFPFSHSIIKLSDFASARPHRRHEPPHGRPTPCTRTTTRHTVWHSSAAALTL